MGSCASSPHRSDLANRQKYEPSECNSKEEGAEECLRTVVTTEECVSRPNCDGESAVHDLSLRREHATSLDSRTCEHGTENNQSTRANNGETGGSRREGESFLSFAIDNPQEAVLHRKEEGRNDSTAGPFGPMTSVHFMNAREGYPLGANEFMSHGKRQWDSERGSVTSSHQRDVGGSSLPDAFGDSNVFGGEDRKPSVAGRVGETCSVVETKRHSHDSWHGEAGCNPPTGPLRESNGRKEEDDGALTAMDRSNALTDIHGTGAALTLLEGNNGHSYGIVTVFYDEGSGI